MLVVSLGLIRTLSEDPFAVFIAEKGLLFLTILSGVFSQRCTLKPRLDICSSSFQLATRQHAHFEGLL